VNVFKHFARALRRLGANVRIGQDWFTKYTLAEAVQT
jgi:hypothetical protein